MKQTGCAHRALRKSATFSTELAFRSCSWVMPGLEKRLARHAQLYSRVGFVHAYKPLRPDELSRLLDERWPDLAPGLPKDGVVDADAISAIVRMTAGNLRLVTRLLDQIRRILALNGLDKIDRGVVDAARESLVIGLV